MDKDTRNCIERATQRARKLLEEDFTAQLDGDFDVHRGGAVATKAGPHLTARQAFQRERIVAAIEHKRAAGMPAPEAVADYIRDVAFTTLNRFVALKMLEARELVQECISKGEQSAGYREFCGLAPGVALLADSAGYRLYIECLFDELSTEVKVLFDRRDPASVLWPKRATFEQLLEILNDAELASVWGEDETIGWVYQYFNSKEERAAMRDTKQGGSQAPRNSRELAVRNQFFTPRYVVQFLTDNTLGRIWYEMRDTCSALAERCEYMVRKPGETFPARPKKDPRDIRVLDPACGSGHFLLYAFDLLLTIYEEAYADPGSPRSEATGTTLVADYPSLDALRRAIPGLVLAHNLHGVDIDARCAQIAQLALWMRAQRAYRDFGLTRAERAQIRRSNIVVAEPLVSDDRLTTEFVARLDDVELGHVFARLVETLKLAGDLGLLLRVETLIGKPLKRGEIGDLFAPPEARIRAALALFVAEEGGSTSMRRRLFAEDATQGVGLLAIAEKKFDVVLMNPPFGEGCTRAKRDFEKAYPLTKNDIYAAFVERCVELLDFHGRIGAITSRTGFFLSSFQKWRESVLLGRAPPVVFADLGLGVMDAAMVEAAAYCLERGNLAYSTTTFLRILEADNKQQALLNSVRDASSMAWFEVDIGSFRAIPGSPFAYWPSDAIRQLFVKLQPIANVGARARQGASTVSAVRHLRLWFECRDTDVAKSREETFSGCRWVPFAKGGRFSKFFYDIDLVFDWRADGAAVKAEIAEWRGSRGWGYHWSATLNGHDEYFRRGLSWPLRTQQFGLRVMPAGCIFGGKGPAIFVDGDSSEVSFALLAIMASSVFEYLLGLRLNAADRTARSYEVGLIQTTPIPCPSSDELRSLARHARRAWSLKRTLDTTNEISHAFLLPQVLSERTAGFRRESIHRELAQIESELDGAVFILYGVSAIDRAAIEASVKQATGTPGVVGSDDDDDEQGEDESTDASAPLEDAANDFASWLVGVSFARFDPRLATGERVLPIEPDPFDALPSRSPGMYPEGEEPTHRPGILVDDEGHADDIVAHARAVSERVCVDIPENLRGWLGKRFFPMHIKKYSKSHRKAPIYWQLATPSASYSVWLYIQAFGRDTLFRVQRDYAGLKLGHEERRLEAMIRELRDAGTARERKAIATQEAFVDELRAFLDEVKRIAPLWNPHLDDGVIINFALLWRLVPQHKPWQKELKATWDSLCEGKYDWAHLAMHLWPERVVPKCATDRSLAIAHGLEGVLWSEGADGKWTQRSTPTQPIHELVLERTSPAVKAALESLLGAPVAWGKPKKSRRDNANA